MKLSSDQKRVLKEYIDQTPLGRLEKPEDVAKVRGLVGDLEIISPGVGAQGGSSKETIKAGANYIIVGRGIYCSDNPAAAAEKYSKELV